MPEGKARPLSEASLDEAAKTLKVGLPALWAVMTVETKGCGFLPDRRPLVLFERHWFHKLTKGKFAARAPDLSQPTWGGYGRAGAYQHERLDRAIQLDRRAALESTSWGLGQVMGFNATAVGFQGVEEMVEAMCQSEDAQFRGMLGFIAGNALAKHLKAGNWGEFARLYNGPDFQRNRYDKKLAQAHARFQVGPLPDLRVRASQLWLSFLGHEAGGVDGWFGTNSQKALMAFQKSNGMAVTGLLDDATFSALEQEANR